MEAYKVLIRVDERGCVADVNSSAFLQDTTGWVEATCGEGDSFRHAQSNFLPEPLHDARGLCRYRWTGKKLLLRDPAELEAEAAALPAPAPGLADRMTQAEQVAAQQDAMLLQLLYDVTVLQMGGEA